jgi:ATP-dependent DNA helicase DinG
MPSPSHKPLDKTVNKGSEKAARVPMSEIFGRGGVLEKQHPAYEFRRSQQEMAEIIDQAFRAHQHVLIEAGTGTGKTLAYLIPAIASGQRVVISTATKSLQHQLFDKDIPFLQKRFAPNLKVALMKGRANFLCRQKVHLMEGQPVLKGLDEVDWFAQIRDWEKVTEAGDRTELGFLPEHSDLWHRLDARGDTCTGQQCAEFDRCFITAMHQRAHQADIIVVNHHLFFADLALRQGDFASIIPEYSAVILDEAHEIEEVASSFFGREISSHKIEDLARDAEQSLRLTQVSSPALMKRTGQLRERSRSFFECFPERDGRFPFNAGDRAAFMDRNREPADRLTGGLRNVETEIAALPAKPEELLNIARRAAELRRELSFLLSGDDDEAALPADGANGKEPPGASPAAQPATKPAAKRNKSAGQKIAGKNYVHWFERRGRGIMLSASPIDVSPILRDRLFNQFDTVVMTSASLAVGNRFDYVKQRSGIEPACERILPQEFDYATQAMLYLPPNMPDVRSPAFANAAAAEAARLLEITHGRAFFLFTSHAQMRDLHERLARLVKFPLLLQGAMPQPMLLEKFRATPHAVLLATASFWQGVDVPGAQLSCVIVDRLPFAVPSDPIVAARVRALQEEGRNAFQEYQVPEAVLALKQGFGRLIRSRNDRGVLALLDSRIVSQSYGRIFIESLPGYAITRDIAAVARFMQSSEPRASATQPDAGAVESTAPEKTEPATAEMPAQPEPISTSGKQRHVRSKR